MKYSDEFHKPDFTNRPYPEAHTVCNGQKDKLPPDGEGQPESSFVNRASSFVSPPVYAMLDEMVIGLSYPSGQDFGPYVQHSGEGLHPHMELPIGFENRIPISAGNIHPHTGIMLFALCLNQRPKVVIETGTFYGFSTMFLLKAMEMWGEGVVYTIEPNQDLIDEVIKDHPQVRCIEGLSEEEIGNIVEEAGEVQFAFLDSYKRNSYREFELLEPHMPEGAIIVFHDTQFLDTGRTLHKYIKRDWGSTWESMLFSGQSHRINSHRFFGNADDRGLFVIRKINRDPFLRVADSESQMYGTGNIFGKNTKFDVERDKK